MRKGERILFFIVGGRAKKGTRKSQWSWPETHKPNLLLEREHIELKDGSIAITNEKKING